MAPALMSTLMTTLPAAGVKLKPAALTNAGLAPATVAVSCVGMLVAPVRMKLLLPMTNLLPCTHEPSASFNTRVVPPAEVL
jgi:hypothetical protein